MNALKVAHRNALVYRKIWRGGIFFSFLTPLLFLAAMGIGVGSLVPRDSPELQGFTYLQFFASGMLAAVCMQAGSFEASFPIMAKIAWQRNYEAMMATPLRVRDLVGGEMIWFGFRLTMISAAFYGVMFIFDVPVGRTSFLAIPTGVLTGLGFAAAVMSYSATQKDAASFNGLFRFVISPLFLFTGAFFPIERLPLILRAIVYITPSYHGVRLSRGYVLGTMTPAEATLHWAALIAFFLIAATAAFVLLSRRLIK